MRARVVERGSGFPLAATLQIGGRRYETDASGRITLALPQGYHVVVVETDDDHERLQTGFRLTAAGPLDVIWRVERFAWDDAVTVYGEEREEVSKQVLTAEELRRVPGSFGDPLRAIQTLPGVARSAGVEGALVVRGAEAINTATYIDGVPVPYVYHFFVGRSIINPSVIDDVEFYPGGLPSRFGDSTQAAINVRTLDTDPKPGLHGRVSADVLDFSVAAESRLGKHWTWQAAYRNSWLPQLISLGAQAYGTVRKLARDEVVYPTLGYQDWLVRGSFVSGRDRAVLTFLGARDTIRLRGGEDPDINGPFDPRRQMDTRFWRIHGRWDRSGETHDQTTWIAAGPDQEASLLEGLGVLSDGIEFGRLAGWNIDVRREDRIRLGAHTLIVGANARWQPVLAQDYDLNQAPRLTVDVRSTVGVFTELGLRTGRTLVSPGIRLQQHAFQSGTFVEPEPRLTVRLGLSDVFTATAFAGRFSQIPPADRYAAGLGNQDVTLMTAWQGSAGLEGRWPNGFSSISPCLAPAPTTRWCKTWGSRWWSAPVARRSISTTSRGRP